MKTLTLKWSHVVGRSIAGKTNDALLAVVDRAQTLALPSPSAPIMTDDGPSSEATLLSLPPEVLTEIVARCGRSVKCPRANPSALLSSCRTLQELGRSAAVRVDFLIAVFGTRFAIEGACMWLPLLRRDVLQGLLRRIEGASHPVPRYQLQRLFHRCTNANRTDLLLEVLVFAEQLYPPPSTKTISRKETQFPDIALGFQVRFTDDDLFEDLVFANPNAMGTAEKDKQWAHLVKEGKNAGWQVAGDRPMTALLTLKNKHGLNPNLSIAGLTSNSLALAPKRLGFYRQEEPAPIFDTDCSIEGLSLGYALLIRAIDTGNERAVRRLLSLGTSVVAEDDSFFWQVIRHVREDDDLELAYKSTEGIGKKLNEDAVAQYPRTNYALRALGFPIGGAYFPVDDFAKVFHFLGEFYQVLEKMEHCQIPNALLHIAKSQTATIEILRTVLSMLQESGWLATPAGRKALAEARDTCLEKNDVRYYELFHSYASSVGDEGEECNLFIILVRGQIDSAKKLVERGERLTPEQIVGFLLAAASVPVPTKHYCVD